MKQGFRVLDSDLHTMEPDDLWPKYLDEPFRRFAPQFVRGTASAPNQPVIRIGDVEIAEMSKRARTAVVGRDLHERSFARHPHYAAAHARGYDSESHVQAMDIEGIDVAVIYGTRGRQVLMHDALDPQVASALARAHNGWTHDFCQYDPKRLKFAAQVAFHDVPGAVAEARRAVRELGAIAVIGNPNPIAGRHIRLGGGALRLVQASRAGDTYRTTVDVGSAPVDRLDIGHTLPRGSTVTSVLLDGSPVDYDTVLTNRGLEVLARAPASGTHELVVTGS